MNAKYEIRMHVDGYEVALVGAARGISTHADILDALAAARVANRYVRELAANVR